jgi:hypothetical protein
MKAIARRERLARRQAGDRWRCALKCSHPESDTLMRRPRPKPRSRAMKPRSFASSHTGSRGHDVRQASSTSAYGRGFGPIHSRRSRTRLSRASSTVSYEHKTRGSPRRPDLPRSADGALHGRRRFGQPVTARQTLVNAFGVTRRTTARSPYASCAARASDHSGRPARWASPRSTSPAVHRRTPCLEI